MPRDKVLDDLINRTEPHEKTEHKPKYIGSVDIPDLESPLAFCIAIVSFELF